MDKRKQKRKVLIMICCKITAEYAKICKNFNTILSQLSEKGIVLWDSGKLYFSNSDDPGVGRQFVSRVLRRNGCSDFFLEVYGVGHEPRENDSANCWISNQLVAIGYTEAEREHQDTLRRMSEQLSQLDAELKKVLADAGEQKVEDHDGKEGPDGREES